MADVSVPRSGFDGLFYALAKESVLAIPAANEHDRLAYLLAKYAWIKEMLRGDHDYLLARIVVQDCRYRAKIKFI